MQTRLKNYALVACIDMMSAGRGDDRSVPAAAMGAMMLVVLEGYFFLL
jgi:hypothetical protein